MRSLPACVAACLLGSRLKATPLPDLPAMAQEQKHKFDNDFRMLTYRQYYGTSVGSSVRVLKSLEPELGKGKLLEIIGKSTDTNLELLGKQQASSSPDRSLMKYVSQFKDERSYGNILTFTIVEESETVFEMNVTECIYATLYRSLQAGDYGYASVCRGDYAWATGFNPGIKLTRDKTLMEGHECCNHRYTLNT